MAESLPGRSSTMPVAVYLCPAHFEHFYVPDEQRRKNGNEVCPEEGCQERMVRFTRRLGARDTGNVESFR